MDNSSSKASDSQDSQDLTEDVQSKKPGLSVKPSALGVQNAKKRLRAFSIQKKTSMSPVAIPKPLSTGSATVFIGKLASVKPVIKPPEDPEKKLPRPPKPGTSRQMTDSYITLRKNTLEEIEDMKRKMELVELGIPLGLICPAPNSVTANKAMPTKAMPPIKSFLDPAKVDEIIREAKKAKAEGKEFKFNYKQFVPDYANPFQRKKDEQYQTQDKKDDKSRSRDKYNKRSDKYDSRRPYNKYSEKDTYRDRFKDRQKERDERHKEKEDRSKQRERSKDRDDRSRERDRSNDRDIIKHEIKESLEPETKTDDLKPVNKDLTKDVITEAYKEKEVKEAEVNLKDFLVCDSWSLDNDDKSTNETPKPEETEQNTPPKMADPLEKLRHNILKKEASESPKNNPKIEKLKPVIDSFKFEIEEDDDMLDMFDESTSIDKFSQKNRPYQSPDMKLFDIESKDTSIDELADDTFLESVINEIKSEAMDESSQDKGLVEYESPRDERLSITPELDSSRMSSSRSDYSDGYKSTESGYKSTESGYKSTEKIYKLTERGYKSPERSYKSPVPSYKSPERSYSPESYKSSERSHKSAQLSYKSPERNYKSPQCSYKSPERSYSPESYKSSERNYKSPQRNYKSPERSYKSPQRTNKSEIYKARSSIEKDFDDRKLTNSTVDSLETWNFVLKVCQPLLFRHDKNRCYKETRTSPKVWFSENPKLCDCINDRSTVYEELEMTKMELVDRVHACDQMSEATFHTARGWYPPSHQCLVESSTVHPSTEWEAEDSQLSPEGREMSLDIEYHRFMKAVWPEAESKSATPRGTPVRTTKSDDVPDPEEPRAKKTKLSSEGWSQESDIEDEVDRKKKVAKEKRKRKHSTSTLSDSEVESKKRKKSLKKKDSKKAKAKSTKHLSKKVLKKLKEKHKKKKKVIKMEETDEDKHKKEKKKKDKRPKKKKAQKQKKKNIKKKKSRKQTSSSSSETTQTDSEFERKKTEKKKKKRQKSTSESTQSDDVFDVNILNNIKAERLSDEENKLEFTKHREIINVKELQNDFVGNSIQIKKETEEIDKEEGEKEKEEDRKKEEEIQIDLQEDKSETESESPVSDVTNNVNLDDIKIPDDPPPSNSQQKPDDSSQDTQDSAPSKVYEKDESHLRPSSQNSNYSFQDVMQSGMYQKEMEMEPEENYEGNYEMYEQMAMEYQSDVATQRSSPQRIETVVRSRVTGEIKCDWRPGDTAATGATGAAYTPQRPSRWGLKPSEVNIVLTGGSEQYPIPSVVQPVYKIQSIANNRNDNSNTGYDEAYQDMYGASDKLQYGDCFNAELPAAAPASASAPASTPAPRVSSLDDRINRALRTTVLGEVAKEPEENDADKENVAVSEPPSAPEGRSVKRVSFADGYKPGQDSDTEAPPKKKKRRRLGCAWPCPSSHPDHVPLWDALPPPPPPPGSPPPRRPIVVHLPHDMRKYDPNLPFMPPEPPPGILNF